MMLFSLMMCLSGCRVSNVGAWRVYSTTRAPGAAVQADAKPVPRH
jgi:hypothetical protein